MAALVVGAVLLGGGSSTNKTNKTQSSAAPSGAGEVFLQAASDNGPQPFGPSDAAAGPSATIPASTPITVGPATATGPAPTAPTFSSAPAPAPGSTGPIAVTARSGGTPGLYGGTRDQTSCDKQKLIDFLAANPDKARAWADVEGIAVSSIASYIDGLTPVLLRTDTRVTNHGFVNGVANPHQDILQAGTAVLVDSFGVPRARCACGNPLLPPVPVATTPTYRGTPWSGFNPGNVTVVNASTTVINVITIIDVQTGEPFSRPTGPKPGPDRLLPGATPVTQPAGPAPASITDIVGSYSFTAFSSNAACGPAADQNNLKPFKVTVADPSRRLVTVDSAGTFSGTLESDYSFNFPDPSGSGDTVTGRFEQHGGTVRMYLVGHLGSVAAGCVITGTADRTGAVN